MMILAVLAFLIRLPVFILGLIIATYFLLFFSLFTLIFDIRFLLNARLRPFTPEVISHYADFVSGFYKWLLGFSRERKEQKNSYW